MKMLKTFSALSVVITVISIGATGCYQPDIPKENILPDVAIEIEEKIKELYSWNPLKRRNAVVQRGQMNARAIPAIPFLISVLDDRIWLGWLGLTRTNEEAAKALVRIGEPAVEPLISSLKGTNWRIRVRAALALGEIKDSRAAEPLLAILKDEDHIIRASAVMALAKIIDPSAMEPLIAALKDKSKRIRRRAAVALGGIKDYRAIEPLIAALKDERLIVRVKSAYALYEITGTDLGRSTEKWQEWWAKNKQNILKGHGRK